MDRGTGGHGQVGLPGQVPGAAQRCGDGWRTDPHPPRSTFSTARTVASRSPGPVPRSAAVELISRCPPRYERPIPASARPAARTAAVRSAGQEVSTGTSEGVKRTRTVPEAAGSG
ncbi:hypothetical protein AWW66_29480 [Micromonospora rosaria]|uniref:Uncharacterized protein n=1 Tax=Micromonospora rosaria TaxID=47874 RepID=A0A136PJ99_9ACTN|nr:hypothetical protein AWW66_29480 [Micromonospora rosaria]